MACTSEFALLYVYIAVIFSQVVVGGGGGSGGGNRPAVTCHMLIADTDSSVEFSRIV